MASVFGVKIVQNDFPQIIERLSTGEAAQVVQQIAERIASNAASRAPKGSTGRLSGSVTAVQVSALHWQVTADGERDSDGGSYATYVEWGTANNGGPQPFMTPSAEESRPEFEERMRALIFG